MKQYGNTDEYSLKISKKRYAEKVFKNFLTNYLNNSYKKAVAFMIKENKLNEKNTEDMTKIIEQNKSR